MPWRQDRYPPAMRRLHPLVRQKAIAIANAVLEDGRDEGFAIRVGIACARRWAHRRARDRSGAAAGTTVALGGWIPWK